MAFCTSRSRKIVPGRRFDFRFPSPGQARTRRWFWIWFFEEDQNADSPFGCCSLAIERPRFPRCALDGPWPNYIAGGRKAGTQGGTCPHSGILRDQDEERDFRFRQRNL